MLSEYGQQYLESLEKLHQQHQAKRNLLIRDLQSVKTEGKAHIQELQNKFRSSNHEEVEGPSMHESAPSKEDHSYMSTPDQGGNEREGQGMGSGKEKPRSESKGNENRDEGDISLSSKRKSHGRHDCLADRPEWVGVGITQHDSSHHQTCVDSTAKGGGSSRRIKKSLSLHNRPEWVDVGSSPVYTDSDEGNKHLSVQSKDNEMRTNSGSDGGVLSLGDKPEWVGVGACTCGAERDPSMTGHNPSSPFSCLESAVSCQLSANLTARSDKAKDGPDVERTGVSTRRNAKPPKGSDGSCSKPQPGIPQKKLVLKSKKNEQSAQTRRESLESLAKSGGRLSPMKRSDSCSRLDHRDIQARAASHDYVTGEELGSSNDRHSRSGSLSRHHQRYQGSEPLIPAKIHATASSNTPWK